MVDFGYVSVVNVNYFSDTYSHSFEKQFSFKLPENFNDHSLNIKDIGVGHEFVFSSNEK